MIYLTKEQITHINHVQIDQFGGNFVPPNNFLNESNLDYLLEAVEGDMFGKPMYPEIHDKAGVYMFNIIANHVFQDGNKRTGLQTANIFLKINGYEYIEAVSDQMLIEFTLSVASGQKSLEEVQTWFKEHIEAVG